MADEIRTNPDSESEDENQTRLDPEVGVVEPGVQPSALTEPSGFDIEARSQFSVVLGRFLQHKLAVASLIMLLLLIFGSLLGGRFWTYQYADRDIDSISEPPSLEHPFGTDEIGHDALAQVLRGAQKSVQIALVVAAVSVTLGTFVGALAGFYRGWIDNLLMRVTDLVLVLPALVLFALLAQKAAVERNADSVFGGVLRTVPSWFVLAMALALISWMAIARIVRGVFLSLREKEFVEAARAIGASDARIMFRHLLPNAVGPIIVNATITVAVAILVETALSYLGLGVQLPDVSLGSLVDSGQQAATTRPWLFYFPGVTIILIALTVNFVGDGLRDAFDPTQTRVKA